MEPNINEEMKKAMVKEIDIDRLKTDISSILGMYTEGYLHDTLLDAIGTRIDSMTREAPDRFTETAVDRYDTLLDTIGTTRVNSMTHEAPDRLPHVEDCIRTGDDVLPFSIEMDTHTKNIPDEMELDDPDDAPDKMSLKEFAETAVDRFDDLLEKNGRWDDYTVWEKKTETGYKLVVKSDYTGEKEKVSLSRLYHDEYIENGRAIEDVLSDDCRPFRKLMEFVDKDYETVMDELHERAIGNICAMEAEEECEEEEDDEREDFPF